MLVSCGLTKATLDDGREWTFRPSFDRIAQLGHPPEIVELFAELHHPGKAPAAARFVLLTLCDTEAHDLTGYHQDAAFVPGAMPERDSIILAQHLMRHGICGRGTGGGKYSPEFHAHEYVAAAVVHFGMSQAEAEQLSMSQFQDLFAAKYPDQVKKAPPSKDEYKEFMARMAEVRKKRGVKNG